MQQILHITLLTG